jgi:hypothetical protein
MTRDQAEERAARLNREHPDRATHRWMARSTGAGEWQVVKLSVPNPGPMTATTEARPRPPFPDDPRPAGPLRDVPPYGPG